jgi:hypothetical protein
MAVDRGESGTAMRDAGWTVDANSLDHRCVLR